MVLRQFQRWILRRKEPETGVWQYWAGNHWTYAYERATRYPTRLRLRMGRLSLPDGPYGNVRQIRVYETNSLYQS